MKHLIRLLIVFCFSGYGTIIQAQSTIPATGGNAAGAGGQISYTVGQVVYTTITATAGSVTQGIQQPYEISIVTSVNTPEDLNVECMVYPNPTSGLIKLVIKPFENNDWRLKLYNANSILLEDRKIENEETEILFENLPASVYFLRVSTKNKEIKVFKIVKN